MASRFCNTGIPIIGEVPWGTHFCHFYETKQDLLDTLLPYFKTGLESNEFCMWVVSNTDLITTAEAEAALAKVVSNFERHLSDKNIEILNAAEWYPDQNGFILQRVINSWEAGLKHALEHGYNGMRVSGDTGWLTEKDWKDFNAYEKQLNDFTANKAMIILCTYPLAKSRAADVLDVVEAHQFATASRNGEWQVIETPELRETQAEVKRLNEELEQRVDERTKELVTTNEALKSEITSRKLVELALDERLRFETLVTELSAAFANLSPDEVDREIDKWLQTFVEFLGVDRASFFQFSEDWTTLYLGHSYTVPGIEPLSLPPTRIDEQFPWITDQLRRGNTVKWSRIPDDLPEQAAEEKKHAASTGAKSVLNIPVLVGGSVICTISFTSIGIYRDWPDATVARLRLVGEIFAAAVERKRADAERKRAEEALRESEARNRAILKALPDLIFILTNDGFLVDYYAKDAGDLPVPPEQFLGKQVKDVLPPELAEYITRSLQEISEASETRVLEYLGENHRYFEARVVRSNRDEVLCVARNITERKQVEDELRSGQERYRKLSENLPNGAVITYDTDLRVTFIAGRGLHEAGSSSDFLMGKLLSEIAPPEVVAIAEPHFRAAFEGQTETYECPYPDGRAYFCAVAPLLNSDGLITEIQVITQDITKRKQAEEALRASEQQFRQLAENIRGVFWLATADLSKMLYISPAYEAVWGRSRASLYREAGSFFAAIHAEDRSRVADIVGRNREQGFEVEYRVVRLDGSIRWIRDRGFPIRDDSGRFYRVAGIAEDITDREQAQAELKQRQNQLAEAQLLAHLGSWSWTLKTDTFSWSDELYRILGVDPQSFTPVYESFIARFVHPEDRPLVKRIVENSLRTLEPFSFYYRVLRPHGEERIIHARGHIISDELGEPVRMFGTAQDVTERKRAEEKLKATTEQMRALSARIHSAKEEESTRIARELHDELGSSLTGLKWGLDELDGILSSGEKMLDIDNLREKISSMITLTDSTVDTVRRISSELHPLILEDVGLTAALRWQTRRFETRTGIVCNFSAFLEAIELTREQATAVFRIFQEALTNVARHSQATEVEISLKEEAEQFVLTISDNGRGIKPTEPSAAQSLGLVGMRERAHLVRGEVSINGSLGQGTMVVVRIPVAGPSQVGELIH